jgi:hypothetical protein
MIKQYQSCIMKKLVMIMIGISFSITGISQSCLPDGINFTSQAQIDNFQANFPGCTEIGGTVEIEGDNILNLDGLSVLTSIGGSLYITQNDSLNNLLGLSSLTSVGGSLFISTNSSLTSFEGLDNLLVVDADVFISNNQVLTDISALGNINAENVGDLWITLNSSLETCDNPFICNYLSNPNGVIYIKSNATGCNNPPEIADDCGITLPCLPFGDYNFYSQAEIDNFQLNYPGCTDLAGTVKISGSDISSLDSLCVITSIEGSLEIHNNPLLTSLSGLDSLTVTGNAVTIVGNSILTDISALSHIDTSSVTFLGINNNPLLSECEIMFVCDYLSGYYGSTHFNITGNNDGCKNLDEVLQACMVNVIEIMDENPQMRISPNPASRQITVETTDTDNEFQISIFNYNGQEVLKFKTRSAPVIIDIHNLPAGIYFVRLAGEMMIGVEKFIKID